MSFAGETKKELTLVSTSACCRLAELSGIASLNGRLWSSDNRRVLDVETENVAIARRIYTQFREEFAIHPEVAVRKKMRLKKNRVYAVRIFSPPDEWLERLGWHKDPQTGIQVPGLLNFSKECCRRSFLRGVFLAAGSINDPGSHSYHLELSTMDEDQALAVRRRMNQYGLHARLIARKRNYVVYLKEGEKIVEFLSLIGAHQALLKFEDVRILKGMRNQVNRLVNCETANMNKTIGAAVRQLEVIRIIEERMGLQQLSERLREAAEIRWRYPEANLQELCARMGNTVSKSGLNHRFHKLEEIAKNLQGSSTPLGPGNG